METFREKLQRIRSVYFGNFWDTFTWLVIASMFLWGVAKALGWISTPLIIQAMPILGAVFLVGRFFQKFETVAKDLNKFKEDTGDELKAINHQLHRYENRLIRIETKLT